ncbi:MAG: hypothetical protein JW871_00230 [Endomicrobiales bacterium]|nr:hypothetical protein [Endomicrobiales bacterium]
MNNKGQVILVVMGILVVFLIMIPVLVNLVINESRWSTKQKLSTIAFHAAEAGIDRGRWKLNEHASNWNTIIAGGSIAGYTGTTVYDFASNNGEVIGQYKVTITTGTSAGQVLVRSVGHDRNNNEVRAIEVVFAAQSSSNEYVLSVDGTIDWKPNLEIHWGPVVTFDSITSAPNDYYPRKYSAGAITGRDTDPTPLNSDEKEYWAFEELGTAPQINLTQYKSEAESSVVPVSIGGNNKIRKATGSQSAVAVPSGSGYFPASSNNGGIRFSNAYSFSNSSAVIYTDGTIRFDQDTFLDVKAVIAESDVVFKARSTSYNATMPDDVALEYVKKKEITPGYTYPGESTFPNHTISNCGMHGFLYCGGDLSTAGGNSILSGSIKIIGNVEFNTFTIYYDKNVAVSIETSGGTSTPQQVSWQEVSAAW